MESKTEKLYYLFTHDIGECTRCKLHETRSTIVFGEGSADAEIMFIGEGPGRDEDQSGRPFVGRAGQLLTSIIEKGFGIPRSAVYIANIVKCRPTVDMAKTRDRPPDDNERDACTPFLLRQIQIINPRVIVTLGNPSTRFLLKTKAGITRIRGQWHDYRGIPVMPMYHPSYILRNGGEKSPLKCEVWDDVRHVMNFLTNGCLPAYTHNTVSHREDIFKKDGDKEYQTTLL